MATNFFVKIRLFVFVLIVLVVVAAGMQIKAVYADDQQPFAGQGTKEDPYRIAEPEDLIKLSSLVNGGNEFENKYFLQTAPLNFEMIENFKSIGTFGGTYFFKGIYDGNGQKISNISIISNEVDYNVAIWGYLCGAVINLAVDNATVEGECVAVIASHGNENAKILNCVVTNSTVIGNARAGIIADNLGGGEISSCASVNNADLPLCSYNANMLTYCAAPNIVGGSIPGSLVKNYYTSDIQQMCDYLNSNLKYVTVMYKGFSLCKWEISDGQINLISDRVDYSYKNSVSFLFVGPDSYKVYWVSVVIVVLVGIIVFVTLYFYKNKKKQSYMSKLT